MRPHFLKRILLFLLFLAVAFAFAHLWGFYNDPSRPDVRHKIFGNQKRLDDFLASQDVTAQRLHYSGSLTNVLNPGPLSSYAKDSPVPVAPAQAREVQQLLQQPSSYSWDFVTACLPDYGMLLTFHNDQRTIRIAFCYQCKQLAIFDGDKPDRVNRQVGFDPIHTQLVAVAKAIFPNDSEIQALK